MVNSMENNGKLAKGGTEKRVLSSVRRLMREMDSHNAMLMKKEKALQSALQKQFDGIRQRTNSEVATMKKMVKEIEDFDKQKGVGSTGLKQTMGKIKEAMTRFEDINRLVERILRGLDCYGMLECLRRKKISFCATKINGE